MLTQLCQFLTTCCNGCPSPHLSSCESYCWNFSFHPRCPHSESSIYSLAQSLYIPPSVPMLLLCGFWDKPLSSLYHCFSPLSWSCWVFLSKANGNSRIYVQAGLEPITWQRTLWASGTPASYLPSAGIIGVSHPSLPQPLLTSTGSSLQTQKWKNIRCVGCGDTLGKERQIDLWVWHQPGQVSSRPMRAMQWYPIWK